VKEIEEKKIRVAAAISTVVPRTILGEISVQEGRQASTTA
jgi:hypothetical protein